MKIISEIRNGDITPQAGCVCTSGWKSTRGPWQPFRNCNCSCRKGNTRNFNSNFKKARNA